MRSFVAVAILALVVAVPATQAQVPALLGVPEPTGFVQLTPPHLIEVQPGASIPVDVRVWGRIACDPASEPPRPIAVYISYGVGHTYNDLKVWDFGQESVAVPWRDAGDGLYELDTIARFHLHSDGLAEERLDHAVHFDLEGQSTGAPYCTPAGYELVYGMGQGAIVAPAAATSPANESPGTGLLLLLCAGLVAFLLRRR